MKTRRTGRAVLVCLLLVVTLIAGCATMNPVVWLGMSVGVSKPFLIARSDKPMGWGFVSHPYLWMLESNTAFLTYSVVGDIHEGNPGVAAADWPAYSRDAGQTWQFGDPRTWGSYTSPFALSAKKGDTIIFSPGFTFGMVTYPDGSATAHRYDSRKHIDEDPNIIVSEGVWSDGKAWYGPRPVTFRTEFPAIVVHSSPHGVLLPDGSVLCHTSVRAAPNAKKTHCLLFRSTDRGQTFEQYSVIAAPEDTPWGDEGGGESAMLRLPDGKLLCVMRTGTTADPWRFADDMLQCESTDDGKTWTRKRLRRAGVCPKLLRMSNGILVCAYGRPGNYVMFSLDEGKTWVRPTALTANDAKTSGYIGLAEVAPGRLLVTYDLYDSPPRGMWLWEPEYMNAVYGVFVDVSGPDLNKPSDGTP
jgi:hypothetical protein